MIAFRDDILPPTSEQAINLVQDIFFDSNEVRVNGPRNCGKTMLIAMSLLTLHDICPNLESLVVRAEARTVSRTIIPTIKNRVLKYPLNDPRQPFRAYGGIESPSHLTWKNGGHTLFGGVDDSAKYLGGEYDFIWYNQFEREKSEQAWADLLGTQAGGRGGNWYDADGNARWILVGDCNPDRPEHFLYRSRKSVDWYNFTHKDSPALYADGDWTERGRRSIDSLLDAYPEGYMRERMVYGRWVGAQGQVYKMFSPERHVRKIEEGELKGCEWYASIDWGGDGLHAVGLWAVKQNEEGRNHYYLYKEISRCQIMASEVLDLLDKMLNDYDIPALEVLWVDHDSDHVMQCEERGFPVQRADKSAKTALGSVLEGIESVKRVLTQNRITINSESLDERDPNALDKPQGLVEEITGYAHLPQEKRRGSPRDELPVKENDHHCDMARYLIHPLETSYAGIEFDTFSIEI